MVIFTFSINYNKFDTFTSIYPTFFFFSESMEPTQLILDDTISEQFQEECRIIPATKVIEPNKATLRHLTLKQIQNAKADPQKQFQIDNEPAYRLQIVARITNVTRESNKLILTLDDYTNNKKYKGIQAIETSESNLCNIKLIFTYQQ